MTDYSDPNDFWRYDPFKNMTHDEKIKAAFVQAVIYAAAVFTGILLSYLLR